MNQDKLQDLPVERLVPGEFQPRRHFSPDTLAELAQSFSSVGIIEPLVVRPKPNAQECFEIVAGERRWRAAQLAGIAKVPCIVKSYDDESAAAVSLIENINREDLNPIEEAEGYARLVADFDYTHDDLAQELGKSRTKITNSLRLLNLAPQVRNFLIEGKLSSGHGKALAALPELLQIELANRCIQLGWSVRKTEQVVKEQQKDVGAAIRTGVNPDIKRLERIISDQLGSPTKVESGANPERGKLVIEFHNLDILKGILDSLGVKED